MPDITYSHAYDETHNVIHIDNVTKETRVQHQYFCMGCGKEMVSKLGEHNRHHFAHRVKLEGAECSKETYLHQLGKYLFRKWFETNSAFRITLEQECRCSEEDRCPMYSELACRNFQKNSYNLKKYYSICTPEKGYDGYVADLLLEDESAKYPPVFIEIFCKHKCTDEKIKSGHRIIEIKVESEEQLLGLNHRTLMNNEWCTLYNFKTEYIDRNKHLEVPIVKFAISENGKPFFRRCSSCRNLQPLSRTSIYEIAFINDSAATDYDVGRHLASQDGFSIKGCHTCQFLRQTSNLENICIVYKTKGTPKFPKDTDGIACQHYQMSNACSIGVINLSKIKRHHIKQSSAVPIPPRTI